MAVTEDAIEQIKTMIISGELKPGDKLPVEKDLANRLGYRSEAAFARAFKRETGMPPGAVRRLPDALEAFAA